MRKDITEPKHWRTQPQRKQSWSQQRRSERAAPLDAELVDAAFAAEVEGEETDAAETASEVASSADILGNLTTQLDMLEAQRQQIQKMLADVKANTPQ